MNFPRIISDSCKPTTITHVLNTLNLGLLSLWIFSQNSACASESEQSIGYTQIPFSSGGVRVGGAVFDLEVISSETTLWLEQLRFFPRDGQSPTSWDYTVYFREGSWSDEIDGVPVHRLEDAWIEIGNAQDVTSPSSLTELSISLQPEVGATGGVPLQKGQTYSIYLDAKLASGSSGSSNGLRVSNPPIDGNEASWDALEPYFSNSDISLLVGGNKGSAFGSTNPASNLRVLSELTLVYSGGTGARAFSPFEQWISQFAPLGSNAAQPLSSFPGTQIPNVATWALGLSTDRKSPLKLTPPSVSNNAWQLHYLQRKSAKDFADVSIEISSDLQTWETFPTSDQSNQQVSITTSDQDEDLEGVTADLPLINPGNPLFVRAALNNAQVMNVDAPHYDGPYLFDIDQGVKELRVNPGEDGPLVVEELHPEGLAAKAIPIYPEEGTPGSSTRLAPFQVKLWDFPVDTQWDFEQPEKVFAIADVECSFSNTEAILKAGGVIDDNYSWIYGENHLIVNGDLLSRGNDMMALLWLIYKLDGEARAAGGRVHVMIGNHEAMNLSGDVRYVRPPYLWLADELDDLEYKDLLGEDTVLGRWLRTKNTIIRIGSYLVVHAGISPEFVDLGITPQQANDLVRQHLGTRSSQIPEGIPRFLFRSSGPLWDRGLVGDRATSIYGEDVDAILDYFDVNHIIVGHTKADEIRFTREGRVIAIDVNHTRSRTDGKSRALLIRKSPEGDVIRGVYDNGTELPLPIIPDNP